MVNPVRVPGLPPAARLLGACLLGLGLAAAGAVQPCGAASPAAAQQPAAQPDFASADEAVAALIKAIEAGDTRQMRVLLGPGSDKLVTRATPWPTRTGARSSSTSTARSHAMTQESGGRSILVIGENAWPWPIPLVQENGRWRFDAATGAQEILDRRIGRNELLTIQTLLASVEAEKDYFDRLKRGTGTGAYAQRLFSTPGKQDGLYWDVESGGGTQPAGTAGRAGAG